MYIYIYTHIHIYFLCFPVLSKTITFSAAPLVLTPFVRSQGIIIITIIIIIIIIIVIITITTITIIIMIITNVLTPNGPDSSVVRAWALEAEGLGSTLTTTNWAGYRSDHSKTLEDSLSTSGANTGQPAVEDSWNQQKRITNVLTPFVRNQKAAAKKT